MNKNGGRTKKSQQCQENKNDLHKTRQRNGLKIMPEVLSEQGSRHFGIAKKSSSQSNSIFS